MAFGIDTAANLDDSTKIDWQSFRDWKGEWPFYAGRYFGGGYTWAGEEFTKAKELTNGAITRVFPLRANEEQQQETTGQPGYDYGAQGGLDTCTRITNAINAGQLKLPPGEVVNVYLDVEPGVAISHDYWAGYAHHVHNFIYPNIKPFRPAIYCGYTQDAGGKYLPAVRQMLDSVHTRYPSHDTLCHGFWSCQPEYCHMCSPDYIADWSVFAQYSQPYKGSTTLVPLYIYQYAQYGQANPPTGCRYSCSGFENFANGSIVDLDSTSTTGAENYALVIA